VVNDIGSAPDGSEIANSAVQEVVDEIRRAGGSAVASTASVINVATDIIEAAIDNFGSLSIVINNPGIVTNGDFVDLSDEEWSRMMSTHMGGTVAVNRAAWRHLAQSGAS